MSTEAKMVETTITDEMLKEMRSKIGLKLRIEHSINNEEATRLAILKFASGIGDSNSLWSDAEYAQKTRYGGLVAPPSWIISVFSGMQFGWRGLAGFHNASDLEFYKPVFLDDKITPECIFTGFEGPKPSKFAERMIVDWYENNYRNQRNELVTKAKWSVIRVERGKAKETGKYSSLQLPHPWTDEELLKVEEEVLAEEIRGSKIRYWEDVEIGEELKPVVKGPLGITDEFAFIAGGGAPIPRLAAHGVQLLQYRKHPAWAFRDPFTYAQEPIFAVHYNKEAAKAMGLPMPYDVGWQRQCWQIHLLTNWMGNDGWLKKSYTEYRRFVYFSDVVWLKGKVTRKFIDEEGEYCVEVETNSINQRGENVMPGTAVVALPSKENKYWPLDRRLK
jgi:acyl dehydratase